MRSEIIIITGAENECLSAKIVLRSAVKTAESFVLELGGEIPWAQYKIISNENDDREKIMVCAFWPVRHTAALNLLNEDAEFPTVLTAQPNNAETQTAWRRLQQVNMSHIPTLQK